MNRTGRIALIIVLLLMLLVLIWLVWRGREDSLDAAIRTFLLGIDPPALFPVWSHVTFLGSTLVISVITAFAALLLALCRNWRGLGHLAVAMAGAVALENGLKFAVQRARPAEVFAHTMPASFSFPSGHTLFATALYLTLAAIAARASPRLSLPLWIGAALLVALIGASRIFLGVHYPSDVIGGFTAAALWLLVTPYLIARQQTPLR